MTNLVDYIDLSFSSCWYASMIGGVDQYTHLFISGVHIVPFQLFCMPILISPFYLCFFSCHITLAFVLFWLAHYICIQDSPWTGLFEVIWSSSLGFWGRVWQLIIKLFQRIPRMYNASLYCLVSRYTYITNIGHTCQDNKLSLSKIVQGPHTI